MTNLLVAKISISAGAANSHYFIAYFGDANDDGSSRPGDYKTTKIIHCERAPTILY